jgi:hypothetical protein
MKITTVKRIDGFGSQFQTIIYGILYAYYYNHEYIYRPITQIGIYNDPELYSRINRYLNLEGAYNNYYSIDDQSSINTIDFYETMHTVENNLDYLLQSDVITHLKNIFWENKDKMYDKKNNIAIHIRRHNKHDHINGMLRDYNPLEYYLNIINKLRPIYNNYTIHIFSQGKLDEFTDFISDDVVLHIDEDMNQNDFFETFSYLVAADVLVTSRSSFSYIAAYLSDGVIYYENICHKPATNWVKLSNFITSE